MSQEYKKRLEDVVKGQRDLYRMRERSSSHTESIRAAIKFNSTDEKFSTLLKNVFGHHELMVFKKGLRGPDPLDELSISRLFHTKHFEKTNIFQGTDAANPALTGPELVQRLTRAKLGQGSNEIDFFVGGIGTGKTTYLCNFVFSNYQEFLRQSKLPVRVNLDVETDHSVKSLFETIKIIIDVIFNHLDSNEILSSAELLALKNDSWTSNPKDLKDLDVRLAHLIELLADRHKLQVVLIIDNLDYLYHLGDRGFFSEVQHEDQRNAYSAILELISFFARKRGQNRCAGLGINVCFSVRKDTLEFIKSKQKEVPVPSSTDPTFSIEETTKDRAKQIVQSRFRLAQEVISSLPPSGSKSEYEKAIQLLIAAQERTRGVSSHLFDDLWRISRRGLRDLINQMANYSWLEFHDERRGAASNRFLTQYYPSILAYGSDGRRRYSQFNGNIPNLFLINASVKSNEFAVNQNFKAAHAYTLWLKWLILLFVQSQSGQIVTSDDVVRVFSGKNGNAYPELLVRYVLGALSEVPEAELIEVDVGADGDGGKTGFVRNMTLTKRGEFLLQDFGRKFSYFQLVIDDWRLLLPTQLLGDFDYVDPDLRYLVSDLRDYAHQVKLVVERKGRQCVKFAILMDETLKHEMTCYPRVFSRLRARGCVIPGDDFFLNALLQDVARAAAHTSADEQIFRPTQNWISEYRSRCGRAVDEIFRPLLNLNKDHFV